MVAAVQRFMDDYDLAGACQVVKEYLDALNNWYIRRSRPRFWGETGAADRQDAYDTLFTCLVRLCKAAAPLLPLLCEKVYTGLTGRESVHLEAWPDVASMAHSAELVDRMDRVRDACSVGLSLREAKKLRTRLPLAGVTIAGGRVAEIGKFVDLIKDELNVKHVHLQQEMDAFGSFRLQVDAKVLGPKLGPRMKDVLAATRSGAWRLDGDRAEIAGEVLAKHEYSLQLVPKEGITAAALSTNDMVLVLDIAVTPELEAEGAARDLVRLVQQARKDAGLHVSDRIALAVGAGTEAIAAIAAHQGYVQDQVLATSLTFGAVAAADAVSGTIGSGAGHAVRFALRKA
jgi:isoleucyl-tRNA synthetase